MPATKNNNDVEIGPCGNGLDGNRITAETFANVFVRAYLDASDEVRSVINEMARIVADENADKEDRESAMDTLTEALFPEMHKGELGLDLGDVKVYPKDNTDLTAIADNMSDEEATFADRLARLMEKREISQVQLAEMIGVQQPAISMMLSRNCRPQRRTIEKLAKALDVGPDELWPVSK